MKLFRKLSKFQIIAIFTVLIFSSCSKDNDESSPDGITITVENFSSTIDENPVNGQVIGTVSATTNVGKVSFSLQEESPTGALYIDAATGELKVADKKLFDFEANPTVTGTVKVANGSVSKNALVTIAINDLGDVYEGNVYLETQEDVNTFGANQYAQIKGGLIIGYLDGSEMSDIYDLSPLSSLNKIEYNLSISRNPNLKTTEGLNINEIGTQLSFVENPSLISIVGFNNLTSLESLFIFENNALSNFTGLTQLTNIQSLSIFKCPLMQNIEWLSNVTNIEGSITITSCDSITNIDGLRNLKNTSSNPLYEISIWGNQKLENLNGLQNLSGDFLNLHIVNNPSLLSLNGLNNISALHSLMISGNSLIQNLQGLEKNTIVYQQLIIDNNDSLLSLQGLNNLNITNGNFNVYNNELLTSLDALNNLTDIWKITAYNNPNLIDFCALQNVLTMDSSSYFRSEINAYNPTKQDIIDGNCSL